MPLYRWPYEKGDFYVLMVMEMPDQDWLSSIDRNVSHSAVKFLYLSKVRSDGFINRSWTPGFGSPIKENQSWTKIRHCGQSHFWGDRHCVPGLFWLAQAKWRLHVPSHSHACLFRNPEAHGPQFDDSAAGDPHSTWTRAAPWRVSEAEALCRRHEFLAAFDIWLENLNTMTFQMNRSETEWGV